MERLDLPMDSQLENLSNQSPISVDFNHTSFQNQEKSEASTSNFLASIAKIIEQQNRIPPLTPCSPLQDVPLSYGQERLWLISQLSSASSCYHQPLAFRLKGTLNISALEQSFKEIIRRHQVLRTFFRQDGEKFYKMVHPTTKFTLLVFNLLDNSDEQLQAYWRAEIQRPFDMNSEPLLRASLIQQEEEEFVLLLILHHIACDAWSEGVLLTELSQLYTAFCDHQSSPLPKLPIQYADFAHWQRQWLQGDLLESQLQYWQQQWHEGVEALKLPLDYPQPSTPSHQSRRQSFVFSKALTQGLKTFSQQEGVTLFVMLLAGFQTLLYQYTSQPKILLCVPFAGRHRVEVENLIGYFNNILPIQTYFHEKMSFQEVLHQVKRHCSGALEHQDVPLQHLAELPQLAGKPLSRGMFTLLNIPNRLLNLPGIAVTPLEVDNPKADFDFFLSMEENGEFLTGKLQYKTDLFEEETITQLLQNFQTLLETVMAEPYQLVSSQPRLSPSQKPTFPVESESTKTYVPPRDEVELQLTQIWQKHLGIEPIGITDNFFELGGYSLLALQLFAELETTFNRKLSLVNLFQKPTIAELANLLRGEAAPVSSVNIIPIQPLGSKPPLFCIHVLGKNLSYYRPMTTYLGTDQPLYGLSIHLLDDNQTPPKRVEDIAAYYVKEIRHVKPEGPYFLAGVSFGGLVAFEMAQQLTAQGETVGLLVLLDTYSPANPQTVLKLPSRVRIFRHLSNLLQQGPAYIIERLHERIIQLQNKFKMFYQKYWGQEHLISSIKIDQTVLYLEENKQISAQYLAQPYPHRITLFRPIEYFDDQQRWVELAMGGCEIHEVPGDHISMLQEPHVQVLATKLKDCLDQAMM